MVIIMIIIIIIIIIIILNKVYSHSCSVSPSRKLAKVFTRYRPVGYY